MFSATHRVTIEHLAETGETIDDGMGGEEPVTEWETVAEHIPARFSESGDAIEGTDADQFGRIEQDQPRVRVHPKQVGDADWNELGDGRGMPVYDRDVHAGDDYRVTIHGMSGGDDRRVIDTVLEMYGNGPFPTTVVLGLERQE